MSDSEPSLGQRKSGRISLVDTISLEDYEPDQADVERVLGIEELVEQMKTKWLNEGKQHA